jgi:uncharacterized protein YbjT (DUF2867 family)
MRSFRKMTSTLVEGRGLMLVSGSPDNRNAFIAVDDVARACAEALEHGEPGRTYEVGGPEALSWRQVAERYGEVLGRKVRIVSTPAPVFAAMQTVLSPVAPVPASVMGLNRMMALTESVWTAGGGLLDPTSMTTVREFLEAKAALPADSSRNVVA